MAITAYQGSDYGDQYAARTAATLDSGIKTPEKSTDKTSFRAALDVNGTGRDENGQLLEGYTPPANSAQGAMTPFTFLDFLDIINPLQHIPVVSAIYRHLTGDEIRDSARIAGDALYGGPVGAAIGAADVALKNMTGKDPGETAIALLMGHPRDPETPAETMVAENANALAPAAGDEIIWDSAPARMAEAKDISRFLPPVSTPTEPERNRRTGYPQSGMHSTEKAVPLVDAGTAFAAQEMMSSSRADSPLSPDKQETPAADTGEPGLPPALIAARMMEALDKYHAMKREGL